MDKKKTVPVCVGLAHVRRCFRAIGQSAESMRDFAAAMQERIMVMRECAAADDRIQAYAREHGIGRA